MPRAPFRSIRRLAPRHALVAGAVLVTSACAAAPAGEIPAGGIAPLAEAGPRPVVYAPEAPVDGNAVTDSLVVVTWNVHVGGGDLPAFARDLREGRLTGSSPGAFAILLQEAHREEGGPDATVPVRTRPGEGGRVLHPAPPAGPRVDVVTVARELSLHLAYAPAVPNGRAAPTAPREDRGVAILSSHPMEDVRVWELPRERERRVAVAARIRGERADGAPWSLQLVSAHLENRTGWDRLLDSFGAARARQARFLAEAVGEGPTVLGGDLNTWAPSFMEAALGVLEPHFPHTPAVEGGTFDMAGIPRRLDHLLFRLPERSSAHALVVPDRYGSDHRPVIGVVGLPGSG